MPLVDTLMGRIEHAAEHLPDGWEIRIEVEQGSALVRVIRPDKTDIIIDDGESDICECFRDACIVARDECAADEQTQDKATGAAMEPRAELWDDKEIAR